jgi:hypothetical protein
MKKSALLFLILVVSASGLGAQSVSSLLSGNQAKTPASAQADALGRGTPKGTVLGFLQIAQAGDYRTAADYLQMSAARRQSQGPELASKLNVPKNRALGRTSSKRIGLGRSRRLRLISNEYPGASLGGERLGRSDENQEDEI